MFCACTASTLQALIDRLAAAAPCRTQAGGDDNGTCCLLLLQEYVNGQLKNKYGDAFIRGNNGTAQFTHVAIVPRMQQRNRQRMAGAVL